MREFYDIVQAVTDEQRHKLGMLIGSGFGSQPDTLCDHIKYLRAGTVGQLFWHSSWKQVVTDVADHVGIDWLALLAERQWYELPTQEIEAAVVAKLFHVMFDQLSPEQQQKVVVEMQRESDDPCLEALLLGGSAIAAAKMSGFGLYLIASTVLGGLTNALGLTLPFTMYMGMSQAIALVLGPVGWAALTGGIVWTLNQPNWEKLTLGVVCVSFLCNVKSLNIEVD